MGEANNNMPGFFSNNQQWVKDHYEDIFHEYWEKIFQVLYRLTGCPEDSDDLALEVFWRLWDRPPASNENIGGWLYRVATNLGYNHIRSNHRRKKYETLAGTLIMDRQYDHSPETQFQQSENKHRIRETLKKMKPQKAKLLALRNSGLSYQEIAETLNLSPSSIGKLLNRAEKEFIEFYERGKKDAPYG